MPNYSHSIRNYKDYKMKIRREWYSDSESEKEMLTSS